MNDWQPISTAPRDGTEILGYAPERRGRMIRQDVATMAWGWLGSGGWYSTANGIPITEEVTHWMPLPDPPAVKEEKR